MRSEAVEIVIEPRRAARNYWKDIWRYRELLYFLSWRDLLVRYKQTAVGVLWVTAQPLLTMVVFTVIFGKLAHLSSGGVPYPLLVFAAVLPWQFFSSSLADTTNSLVSNGNLLSKVYFPRLIIPASAVFVCFVDFLVASIILVVMLAWYGVMPTWRIVTLPGFVMLAFLSSFGLGLWLTTLNVKYRDFRYVVPFIVQFGLFISPVGFSSQIVPEEWRLVFSLNPMVNVIDGFRWALFPEDNSVYLPGLGLSLGLLLLVLLGGLWFFRRTERAFADFI